ncbi:DUF2059 domain-containing protein [Desulfatibacillum aliphaticivorans]|uniref:DUF2059 domain-containing protein n=1 Tax=Desulfatibacillum aliphaticivorans TaxID=218208 RepID=B8FM92_DESAL|nr:DUF2059 domain-containing protein [Desulfatibacillum aliphaticivorans]ACL05930.1 hypothetical protein Dalk_4248 [Desulfatibacillum aliphaticivorans]
MKKYALAVFLIAACLCSCTTASVRPRATADEVRDLMVKSGIEQQFQSIEGQWKEGIEGAMEDAMISGRSQNNEAVQETVSRLSDALVESMDAQRFHDLAFQNIQDKMNSREVAFVVDWFSTPLGKKIVKIEQDYTEVGAAATVASAGAALARHDNPKLRSDLIREYIKATALMDRLYVLMENMAFAIALPMIMASPQEDISVDDVRALVLGQLQAQRPVFETQCYYDNVVCYVGLSDEELEEYIRFTKTKATQKLLSTMMDSMEQGFKEVGDKAGKAAAEVVQDIKENGPGRKV